MDRAEELARKLSDRARRTGSGWITLCPAHNDHEPSLHISPAPEKESQIVVHCFAGCQWEILGPILQSYAVEGVQLKQTEKKRGRRENRRWAGAHTPKVEPTLYREDLGEPIRKWVYRTPSGADWLYVARYAPNEQEKKPFRPWSWWRRSEAKPPRCEPGQPPEGVTRYPYRSERIEECARGVPIIVVEGESTVHATMELFKGCEGTTWAGGSGAAEKTSWKILQGRRVVLIPDEDIPGRKAMAWLGRRLLKMGTGYAWIEPAWVMNVRNPSKGWDIAEPLKKANEEERKRLMKRIETWRRKLSPFHPLAMRTRRN